MLVCNALGWWLWLVLNCCTAFCLSTNNLLRIFMWMARTSDVPICTPLDILFEHPNRAHRWHFLDGLFWFPVLTLDCLLVMKYLLNCWWVFLFLQASPPVSRDCSAARRSGDHFLLPPSRVHTGITPKLLTCSSGTGWHRMRSPNSGRRQMETGTACSRYWSLFTNSKTKSLNLVNVVARTSVSKLLPSHVLPGIQGVECTLLQRWKNCFFCHEPVVHAWSIAGSTTEFQRNYFSTLAME